MGKQGRPVEVKYLRKRFSKVGITDIATTMIGDLPKKANFISPSIGESEINTTYRIMTGTDDRIVYASLTMVLGLFVFWARYWIEDEGKMKQIQLESLKER